VVVEAAESLRAVLEDVYAALDLDWNPASVGAVRDEAPGVILEEVRRALLAEYEARYTLSPASLTSADLARAAELLDRHTVDQHG
jgi:hypothetical protein